MSNTSEIVKTLGCGIMEKMEDTETGTVPSPVIIWGSRTVGRYTITRGNGTMKIAQNVFPLCASTKVSWLYKHCKGEHGLGIYTGVSKIVFPLKSIFPLTF